METPNNGASMATELWSIDEVINILNDKVNRFVSEVKHTLSIGSMATSVGVATYDLNTIDTAMVDIFRVAWLTTFGISYELQRSDQFPEDMLNTEWYTTPATPLTYTVANIPNMQIDIMPPPITAGSLNVIYSSIGSALSNTGVTVPIIDDLTPYIKWGVLADMFNKDGPAHDAQRAAYCEVRFNEGIAMAKMLSGG